MSERLTDINVVRAAEAQGMKFRCSRCKMFAKQSRICAQCELIVCEQCARFGYHTCALLADPDANRDPGDEA